MTRADALKLIPAGDLYACDDGDELTETDPEDAIAAWVDKFAEPYDTLAQAIARVPMPVVVKVYERKKVSKSDLEVARSLFAHGEVWDCDEAWRVALDAEASRG